jgi:hypothetical protein
LLATYPIMCHRLGSRPEGAANVCNELLVGVVECNLAVARLLSIFLTEFLHLVGFLVCNFLDNLHVCFHDDGDDEVEPVEFIRSIVYQSAGEKTKVTRKEEKKKEGGSARKRESAR